MNRKPKSTTSNTRKFSKSRFPYSIFLESYGVKIRIGSNEIAAINAIREMLPSSLPNCYRLIDGVEVDHEFLYVWNRSQRDSFYKNGEVVLKRRLRRHALDRLNSEIRLTVAEFAVERVFVHAGVVSWKGKAIVMPAKSYQGKSTLTAELVKRGALYYSDESSPAKNPYLVQMPKEIYSKRQKPWKLPKLK